MTLNLLRALVGVVFGNTNGCSLCFARSCIWEVMVRNSSFKVRNDPNHLSSLQLDMLNLAFIMPRVHEFIELPFWLFISLGHISLEELFYLVVFRNTFALLNGSSLKYLMLLECPKVFGLNLVQDLPNSTDHL